MGTGTSANILMVGAFLAMSAELGVRGRLKPIVTLRKEVQKRREKLGTRYLKTVFSRQVRRDVRFYGNKA